ncbi:glycoside hydrolase family 9 protein [Salegentibacter sp. F188]|uniref:Glycoside hydrolase family 9 protein n=1 Tax=Autumnicola patrickiae TaxID=3075591 RepID=A0ABU3E7F8_9FLAO|nr:glycoside hydrolase family 9 protein [Salegentibacter sp. F188]MDT0691152.1 glycoside hydrolase family 9 protein [Salegentibacter sp. F188]
MQHDYFNFTEKQTVIFKWRKISLPLFIFLFTFSSLCAQDTELELNDEEYFEAPGVNILAFSNWYNGLFSDSKISGIEIIHHGVRTATNGDVRLHATPEQWDAIPTFSERKVDQTNGRIDTYQKYPDYNFEYMIRAEAKDDGVLLSVHLDKEMPEALIGRAGLNMEFIPSAYWEKTYYMDGKSDVFPLYPSSDMKKDDSGYTSPKPMATGHKLVLAPEDAERRVTIVSEDAELMLHDGRDKAQNGWYVVRSLLPEGETGKVMEWFISANSIPGWIRKPVIAHSQVGYHPEQKKVAVIELDKNATPEQTATLQKISEEGEKIDVQTSNLSEWGQYTRYNYFHYDFSEVREPGTYVISYGEETSAPFSIGENIYEDAWHPTNDIYFPVQMDHMLVNEAYRVWHGASHLDDALQAPVNHEHFDLYAQGPTTDTQYEPGEHIPGLNIGGWYDAGDYDIRTQTQYHVVNNLVYAYEDFNLQRDQTLVDYDAKYVDIHNPDGKPDMLQQIEHGTLALIAQHRAVGHAIPGIIVPDISQYTHLGDGLTMTDNLIYEETMDSLESDGYRSGKFDDRWAFTSKSTPLNYGSIAALAAASRVLKGYNDSLAQESIETAKNVWEEENAKEPDLFHHGNTTGGTLEDEKLKAAVELLLATKDQKYAKRIEEMWPVIDANFASHAGRATKALPLMNNSFREKMRKRTKAYQTELDKHYQENPFGVPIGRGGWAGNGQVIEFAINNYLLHKAFPDLIDKEYVFKSLNYIYGTHPDSSISFVSGVGTKSKKVAYGMNRADFSFIAGGVVPGVLILNPDFPENREDWPFLWGQNEYVVNVGSSYIYLVNAVNSLLNE